MEESKQEILIDADGTDGNLAHHSETTKGDGMQANVGNNNDDPTIVVEESDVLNCMLVQVLEKEKIHSGPTNPFTQFSLCEHIFNVHIMILMSHNTFLSVGFDVDFTMHRCPAALNKMHNKNIKIVAQQH